MVLDDLDTLSTNTTDLAKKRKPHWCDDPSYRKSTLKLIREIPYAGAFHDIKGITKFEASVRVPALTPFPCTPQPATGHGALEGRPVHHRL